MCVAILKFYKIQRILRNLLTISKATKRTAGQYESMPEYRVALPNWTRGAMGVHQRTKRMNGRRGKVTVALLLVRARLTSTQVNARQERADSW